MKLSVMTRVLVLYNGQLNTGIDWRVTIIHRL